MIDWKARSSGMVAVDRGGYAGDTLKIWKTVGAELRVQ